VKILARMYPPEAQDSFYSHTQRAFSKGNSITGDSRAYVFNCKKLEKNRLEFVWKQIVDDLNSLKIIGSAELQERPIEDILAKMFDHTIDEIEILRTANEEKIFEIQRITGQHNKALDTVKQTVDMKEKLEADLYRKFVLVLNTKKAELGRLKQQVEAYENEHARSANGDEHSDNEVIQSDGMQSGTDDERSNDGFANLRARSTSPIHTTTTLNDMDNPTNSGNKRSHDTLSDTDTSGDEDPMTDDEINEERPPILPSAAATTSSSQFNQDGLLDLGDDHLDYKSSTLSKHHQRRKYVSGVNSISSRPFASHVAGAGIPPPMAIPSLPDESQPTTDDLLNRI